MLSVGGKGQVGQELAKAIEGLAPGTLLDRVGADDTDSLIANAGDASYILQALDRLSQEVGRGRLILPASPDSSTTNGEPLIEDQE